MLTTYSNITSSREKTMCVREQLRFGVYLNERTKKTWYCLHVRMRVCARMCGIHFIFKLIDISGVELS